MYRLGLNDLWISIYGTSGSNVWNVFNAIGRNCCAILLDYILLSAIVVIIGSSLANSLVPSIPVQVWALVFIIFSIVINGIGVDIMSKCSWVLFGLQMVVILIICVIRMLINGAIH